MSPPSKWLWKPSPPMPDSPPSVRDFKSQTVESQIFQLTSHHCSIGDVLRTIIRKEGWAALYKGLLPSLFLNSVDYAALGGSSRVAAILLSYPFQVVHSRLQQRPSSEGIPRYMDSRHVVRETARFEGVRGFYKGITPNLLKNVPAASITFVVYENVLKFLKLARMNE